VICTHTPSLTPVHLWYADIRVAVDPAVVIESSRTLEGRDIIVASVNIAVFHYTLPDAG
jgi:hypothetical protein